MIRVKGLISSTQEGGLVVVTKEALQLMAEKIRGIIVRDLDDQPIGKVIKAEVTEEGLEIEAEIEEGATEEEFLRWLGGLKTMPKSTT